MMHEMNLQKSFMKTVWACVCLCVCVCVCVCMFVCLSIGDLLKPTLPGTLLATPLSSKSFEELRLEHMTKYKGSSSLWKMEGCGLLSRRLWILDQLLKCKAIEEIILDLVRKIASFLVGAWSIVNGISMCTIVQKYKYH